MTYVVAALSNEEDQSVHILTWSHPIGPQQPHQRKLPMTLREKLGQTITVTAAEEVLAAYKADPEGTEAAIAAARKTLNLDVAADERESKYYLAWDLVERILPDAKCDDDAFCDMHHSIQKRLNAGESEERILTSLR